MTDSPTLPLLPDEPALPAPPWPAPAREAWTPTPAECRKLWDRHGMMEHIRTHCTMVAEVAMSIGRQIKDAGVALNLDELLAGALLHDLAKTHTIRHGGSHAQLGACWVQQETKNPRIAQAVLFHVHWPWEPDARRWPLPLIVQYADKRVKHDAFVSVEERFADLMERYGTTETGRAYIRRSHDEARILERHFITEFGVDPYAHPVDSGRLVH